MFNYRTLLAALICKRKGYKSSIGSYDLLFSLEHQSMKNSQLLLCSNNQSMWGFPSLPSSFFLSPFLPFLLFFLSFSLFFCFASDTFVSEKNGNFSKMNSTFRMQTPLDVKIETSKLRALFGKKIFLSTVASKSSSYSFQEDWQKSFQRSPKLSLFWVWQEKRKGWETSLLPSSQQTCTQLICTHCCQSAVLFFVFRRYHIFQHDKEKNGSSNTLIQPSLITLIFAIHLSH